MSSRRVNARFRARPRPPGRPPVVQIPSQCLRDGEWPQATDGIKSKGRVRGERVSLRSRDGQTQRKHVAHPLRRVLIQTQVNDHREENGRTFRGKLPLGDETPGRKMTRVCGFAPGDAARFAPRNDTWYSFFFVGSGSITSRSADAR